jgi:hypothetical protein
MSLWQFILIDDDGDLTEVENPRNWNSGQVKISRDSEWYGIFFDYVFDTLEFYGIGAQTIQTEYDTKGLKGSMRLRINFFCTEDEAWDLFYEGRLSFPRYRDLCGDLCVVSVGLEQDNDVMLLRNNYEQSVNLNSNVAFDQTTTLTDYAGINFPLTIPGRGIPLKTQGSNHELHSFDLLGFSTWGNISPNGTTGTENGGFLPIYDTTNYAEFQNTTLPVGAYYDTSVVFNAGTNSVGTPPFITVIKNSSLKCQPQDTILQFRIKGRLIDNTNATRSVGVNVNGFIGPNPANVIQFTTISAVSYDAGTFLTTEFDVSFNGPITLNTGDNLYLYLQIGYVKTSSAALQQLIVEFDPETNFLLTGLSVCDDSLASVYLINEATSRVTEAITNGALRFYSTFFGRTDSQPYAIPGDTCAGLFAIINGINLRRRLLNNGAQPGCFITLRNIFEATRSMWNIGVGIEPDLNRPGFNRIRFEDWRFFFQEEIGLVFNLPTRIERRVNPARAYSRFQIGYTKWENEQYSGLNEFMTEREFRNGINSIDTALDRRTSWILASYTSEIARRQDTGTEDYRYDNDIFGFCLMRENDDLEVEQLGDNGSDIENISDPLTCYNGRVSPIRNAMRWFSCFMQPLKQISATDKMLFTKGTGNYVAKFALEGECEIAATPMQENDDIDIYDFADINQAKPIIFPEDLIFDHPLSYNLFKKIKDNPSLKYKSILVNCNGTYRSAWLMDITYTPELGKATITAWPKNDAQLPAPPPPEVCQATVIPGSVTMTGWTFEGQAADIDFTEGVAGATFWQYIVTQGPNPGAGTGFGGTTAVHPFNVTGITPGQWSVMIIPYCGPDDVGSNYATGTFEFEAPPLSIQLRITYSFTEGSPLKSWSLTAEPVGASVFPEAFSFQFGGCNSQGFCNGYPGAFNPELAATMSVAAGQGSTTVAGPGNMLLSASQTSITIFNRSNITPAQIAAAPGETFTINYI